MEQYVKGFQRFYAGEDVRPVTSALARFYHLFQFITKCDSFFCYKVRWSVITKCDSFFIIKCDKCYYKVRRLLQSATVHTSLVNILNWAQYLLKRKFLRNCSKNYLNTILKNR